MWAAPPMLLVDLTRPSVRESGAAAVVGGEEESCGGGGGGLRWKEGRGEGGDGTIVLGETDEWGCEARYHAKQHEKRRKTKLANLRKSKQKV